MTGLPVIACKVGKRGGLEKCGQDMKMYQSNIVLYIHTYLNCAMIRLILPLYVGILNSPLQL